MLCYMTGMPPPNSPDEPGTVIDGTVHSEEWRKKKRAAQRPQTPDPPEPDPSAPVADFYPAAAKDFVSSPMIPANLVRETPQEPATPDAPDPYINTLLDGSREPQPTQEPEVDASHGSAQDDELTASSRSRRPHSRARPSSGAPARQRKPRHRDRRGAGAERARNGGRSVASRAPAWGGRAQSSADGSARLRARVHLTRTGILAGSMLAVLIRRRDRDRC